MKARIALAISIVLAIFALAGPAVYAGEDGDCRSIREELSLISSQLKYGRNIVENTSRLLEMIPSTASDETGRCSSAVAFTYSDLGIMGLRALYPLAATPSPDSGKYVDFLRMASDFVFGQKQFQKIGVTDEDLRGYLDVAKRDNTYDFSLANWVVFLLGTYKFGDVEGILLPYLQNGNSEQEALVVYYKSNDLFKGKNPIFENALKQVAKRSKDSENRTVHKAAAFVLSHNREK